MRDLIINKIMRLVDNGTYNKTALEEMRYGFECIYILITKGIIVFSFAYILGILKYTLFFSLTFGIIRTFACGLHASKSWICTISSLLIFIIIPFLCKILVINKIIRFILMLFMAVLIIKYAPADTKKRPIINKKKRKIYKVISASLALIYISLTFILKNNFILNSLLFSLLLETIMILPITYKIFKLPYNNYINYLKLHNLEGRK